MRKLFFLASFLMVLVMAPMVLADTVSVNRVGGYYSGNGGEFTLFPSFPVPAIMFLVKPAALLWVAHPTSNRSVWKPLNMSTCQVGIMKLC